MIRFNETKVDSSAGTVEVGPGLTWDQVYVALNSTGVNVLGGRVPGVGVAGLTLGGGECLRSSESESWVSVVLRLFVPVESVRTFDRQHCRIRARPSERDYHKCDFKRRRPLVWVESK